MQTQPKARHLRRAGERTFHPAADIEARCSPSHGPSLVDVVQQTNASTVARLSWASRRISQPALLLVVLGLLTRLAFIDHPHEISWDEIYFGSFAQSCFTHTFFFDIHPPLGKLLIALGAYLGGFQNYLDGHAPFSFNHIGQPYGFMPFTWFRLFPAIAGGLIPWAVYVFLRQLKISRSTSLLVGTFLIFDNALLTQSRLILIDSFVIVFGFLGLACFIAARLRNYHFDLLFLAGICFGASCSSKWTGFSYLALAGLIVISDCLPALRRLVLQHKAKFGHNTRKQRSTLPCMSWAQGQRIFLTLVLLPLMVYIGSFRILCSLADHWGPDTVFVSHQFQTESFWTKFVELNTKMYTLNAGLSKPHQDSSPAHLWPLMCKPVFYWQSMPDASTHNRGYIYMVGNPVLWYGGLAGLLMFLVSWRKIQLPSRVKRLMIAGYFLNWVPFLLVHRVLFLYHYLAAFIFTVILCAFGITVCANQGSSLQRRIIYASSIVAVMVGFLLYAPVSYGLPISKETHDALLGWLVR